MSDRCWLSLNICSVGILPITIYRSDYAYRALFLFLSHRPVHSKVNILRKLASWCPCLNNNWLTAAHKTGDAKVDSWTMLSHTSRKTVVFRLKQITHTRVRYDLPLNTLSYCHYVITLRLHKWKLNY